MSSRASVKRSDGEERVGRPALFGYGGPMQARLSSPPGAMKPAYDVVVVGSGYGGGVSASRLSRAGLRVCGIERGRAALSGEFPARLPELRRELQVNCGKMRSGRRTGLFDFRMGSDIHLLVGCGLG